MKILVITHYFSSNGGGIEIIAARLAAIFRAQGHKVEWLAAKVTIEPTNSLPESPDDIGLPAWDGIRKTWDLAFPIIAPWKIPTIWSAVSRADIIHLHESFYPLHQMVLWIAFILRKPVVVTQHIADMPIKGVLRGNAVKAANIVFTRPAFAVAKRIIFYSHRTQKFFQKWNPAKQRFIYNGCDAATFSHAEDEDRQLCRTRLGLPVGVRLFLFVGRFIEKKGMHKLLDSAARNPDCHFVFVGRGPIDPATAGLRNITVRPQMTHAELAHYYQAADALVLPSVGEGLPLVVQEASTAGIPSIVSTEILEACPELDPWAIDAGPEGLDIAEAIKHFVPDAREKRLSRAKFAMQLWSWPHCAESYAHIFTELI